jgi:hypothetical protein
MNASRTRGEARVNGSVRRRAGARWSASGSGSGAGEGAAPGSLIPAERGHGRASRERRSGPEMSLTY